MSSFFRTVPYDYGLDDYIYRLPLIFPLTLCPRSLPSLLLPGPRHFYFLYLAFLATRTLFPCNHPLRIACGAYDGHIIA